MAESIARRYAHAFHDLAVESGASEALAADLDKALSAMNAHEGLLFSALSNPVFTTDERKRVLVAVLPKLGLLPLTKNLLQLLLDKGRFAQLPAIAEEFRKLADVKAGRERVVIESAQPLDAALTEEIRAALAKALQKQVLVETRVKPELIGGLVARLGGRVIDASVKNRIEALRRRLLSAPTVAEA